MDNGQCTNQEKRRALRAGEEGTHSVEKRLGEVLGRLFVIRLFIAFQGVGQAGLGTARFVGEGGIDGRSQRAAEEGECEQGEENFVHDVCC